MNSKYGRVALIYRPLSRLFLGNKPSQANSFFLEKYISGKTLVVGGGDGWDYVQFQGILKGEYWEISDKMLALAKRNLPHSGLTFRLGSLATNEKFDTVLLPFILDTIVDEEMAPFLKEINARLKAQGKVILSDFFVSESWCQKLQTLAMILFFRIFASHERKNLPDYGTWMAKQGWVLREEKIWKNGWIRAQVWEKG